MDWEIKAAWREGVGRVWRRWWFWVLEIAVFGATGGLLAPEGYGPLGRGLLGLVGAILAATLLVGIAVSIAYHQAVNTLPREHRREARMLKRQAKASGKEEPKPAQPRWIDAKPPERLAKVKAEFEELWKRSPQESDATEMADFDQWFEKVRATMKRRLRGRVFAREEGKLLHFWELLVTADPPQPPSALFQTCGGLVRRLHAQLTEEDIREDDPEDNPLLSP